MAGSEDQSRIQLKVSGEEGTLRLSDESGRVFVAALLDPPEPNENLRRLARRSQLARRPENSETLGYSSRSTRRP